MEDLEQLEAWAGALLERLTPVERRKLARAIALDLRRSQVARIAGQQNPDGSPFAPRKPQLQRRRSLRSRRGGIKRQAKAKAMFVKIRKPEYLSAEATADEAAVGFKNPHVARIARVHQEGLRDKVVRKPGAKEVRYPARQLLGFTDQDRQQLMDRILAHVEA